MEFQNPQLDGAFEILRIPKNHMRPFKWLKFGILAKQIWYFKKLSHHVKKKQYARFMLKVLVNKNKIDCMMNNMVDTILYMINHN